MAYSGVSWATLTAEKIGYFRQTIPCDVKKASQVGKVYNLTCVRSII